MIMMFFGSWHNSCKIFREYKRTRRKTVSAAGSEPNTLERRDPNNCLEDFFNTSVFGFSTLPEVEIRETPSAYLMEVEAGTPDRGEVRVVLEGNLFTIESYNPARRFKRSFVIPPDVERRKIREGFSDGMLRFRFPRKRSRTL
jgi:HSP20 family molecular chaperone IbpA